MRALAFKKTRALVVLVVTLAGLALTSSAASAAVVSIDLCAKEGTATLTGAVTVPIWGFGVPTTPGDCSTATAGLPGPVLTANAGDIVTVNVTNTLPSGHTVRFEIPGINFDPGPTDAPTDTVPPGSNIVSRTFTASAPGTYLYQSAGDGNRQEAMGLYGALIVRSGTANQAYNDASTAYNVEAPLVLSAVDPAFNGVGQPAGYDPNDFNMYTYRATYWLINGKAYPDTAPITAGVGQKVLLRYVNAGFDNTSMQLLGMHERVLARDASLLNNPFDADAETIPAGGTEDAIATVPASPPPSANGFALYNRQLHLTNGPQTAASPTPATGGGMLTFIHP
jgi:FtsP/CotA-like multicopper oxidase with cupredoxin domain